MEEQQSLASSTGADGAEKLQAEQEPAEIKPKKRDIHSDMQHEPCCFTCGKDDEDLIPCSFCPKTFHAACLPVGTKITAPRWGCPSHKCMVCGAATSKSRGKIYRCAYCPSAYCFTHLPVDSRVFATNPLEKYGYHTTSFFFINCPPCLERRRAQTKQEPGLLEPTEGSKADADEGELLILIRKRKRSNRASTGSEEGSGGSDPPPPPPVKKPKSERNEVDPLTPNVELIYSLKRLMHINKVSQKQVSKDLRVSESTLSAFMNEKSRISGWVEFEDRVRKWLAANGDHVLEYELDKKREQVDTNRLKLESQFYSSSHFANIHPEVQQQLVSSFTPTNAGNNYSQPHLQPYRVNMQNGFTADEHYSHNHNHNHTHNESMHANHAPNVPAMSAQHSNSSGMPPNHNMQPGYYHSFIPPQHQFSNMHGNFSPMYPVPHMPTPLHLVPTPSYPPQFFDPIAQGSHSPNGFKNDSNNSPTTGSSSLTILSHMNNLAPPSTYPTNTSNAQKGNFVAHPNNMQQPSPLTTMIAQSINNANHSMNNNPASAPNQNQFPFNIQPTFDKRNGQSFGMSPSPFTPTAPGLGPNLSSYSSVTSNTGQQMTAGSNFDRQLPPVPRMLDPLLNRTGPAFMPPHPRPSEIWK